MNRLLDYYLPVKFAEANANRKIKTKILILVPIVVVFNSSNAWIGDQNASDFSHKIKLFIQNCEYFNPAATILKTSLHFIVKILIVVFLYRLQIYY